MANEKHDFSSHEEWSVERRSGERMTSVFRPIIIATQDFGGFCLLRNLSAGGMMGTIYTQLAENLPILVRFHAECAVAGTVAWSADDQIGVAFDQKIDVREILGMLGDPLHKINRSPRLEIESEAVLESEGRRLPIRVLDISQRGIKVEGGFVRSGDEGVVHIAGLESRRAIVRWSQDGIAGLNFVRLIPFEELARWVIGRQAT